MTTIKKRVSLCFFSLKPLDIEFMKRLHDKVNVIPLIAKADTLTPEECQLFKKQVFAPVTSGFSNNWLSPTLILMSVCSFDLAANPN